MQNAFNNFTNMSNKLGFVINELKTKFMCRSKTNHDLTLNGEHLERVRSYKYLGAYVGYTAESKEVEMRHLTTQARDRLKAIKALAWSGRGVGVPVLRKVYVSVIRSLLHYASPVLSYFDEGRLTKLETLQNDAMRVILGCPKNTVVSTGYEM